MVSSYTTLHNGFLAFLVGVAVKHVLIKKILQVAAPIIQLIS